MTDPVRKAARERAVTDKAKAILLLLGSDSGTVSEGYHLRRHLEELYDRAALDQPPTQEPLDDALRNAHRTMCEGDGPEYKDCCADAVMDYEGHVRRLAGLPDSLHAALSRVHGHPAAVPTQERRPIAREIWESQRDYEVMLIAGGLRAEREV